LGGNGKPFLKAILIARHFQLKGGGPMKEVEEQEAVQALRKQVQEGVFLIVETGEKKNLMTIGWALSGYVWRRSTIMVAVRNSRFTYGLIEKADSFTVGVPSGNMEKSLQICGSKSGRDIDKFRECRLETRPAKKVTTPILQIPGYHIECRITCKVPMDPKNMLPELETLYPARDYHTLYFGEILACSFIE
jgi:flavin reductase (DIM6/NTAB) family NADH-FMN oxidoreductase RutF